MSSRVLVVPAGTEIGHEVYESLRYSKHWELVGANAVRDHSEVTFPKMHFGLPFVDHNNFVHAVQSLVKEQNIEFVVPAHDEAIFKLSGQLTGAVFVGPHLELSELLRFKSKILMSLRDYIPVPAGVGDRPTFPIFAKPDRGQGSRGARIVRNEQELTLVRKAEEPMLLQEFLPGPELTIDCFSSPNHEVIYCTARKRDRVSSGIATRMQMVEEPLFLEYAAIISRELKISGAWFFQVKQDAYGVYKLLEVANRIAGSSGFQRAIGINLMDAWLHQISGREVSFIKPLIDTLIYDRALYARMKLQRKVKNIYVDFDDTLIFNKGAAVHHRLIGLLYAFKITKGVPLTLVTRHNGEIDAQLRRMGLIGLFDDVVHLKNGEKKSSYINPDGAVFIDDAFSERKEVGSLPGVICLPPESIEMLEAIL
ncbi:ATP-grasp domain-containing protein [Rhizobium sp. CNPSo 3464]|uniref:ATP-grasp domain-containing protein n=1 Tax=Rhizobium sp. CNPSo 3464 TaxID=3021406 RepID=UPI00254D2232|nr:ATP-grasp domain-containing protein [Rhizobium sp. CNPSo 3464]MDK4742754.1 ATP-grasp domain-containing protein [Rhizobium sp. CNPSo 3464]